MNITETNAQTLQDSVEKKGFRPQTLRNCLAPVARENDEVRSQQLSKMVKRNATKKQERLRKRAGISGTTALKPAKQLLVALAAQLQPALFHRCLQIVPLV